MKTKNILKIGIFSITLFALLISPILKFNTPQVNAFGGILGLVWGTSATGLNLEDYLNTCSSPGANSIITSNPTTYSVICCNNEDLNFYKVKQSASYSTIVSNCETAQENASNQAIPVFDQSWCFDTRNLDSSNIENASNYIEKCCKSGDQATGVNATGTQKQIDKLCKKAADALSTYLQTETAITQKTDIKYCVVKEYDEDNETIVALYNDNALYIEKCCNFVGFAGSEVDTLSPSDQALLAKRCEWAKDENIDLFTGKPPTLTPTPEPPHYYGPNITEEQYKIIQAYIKEKSAEEICSNVGSWSVGFPAKIDFGPLFIKLTCVIQKGIIEGLGKMFAGIMNLEINMIIWAFNPSTYGGFVNNPAVQGTTDNPGVWNFIRNLINMLLVLALVVIAIASILSIKKYSWQNILWKLVIVALLVNFSLVIAGMILDTSNFLSYYFLNLAKIENKSISESISSSFDVEKISDVDKYELPSVYGQIQTTTTGWGMSWGQFLLVFFVLILIGLFAVIALLAVFLAMIVRSFIIIVLLCLSPAAFVAWIFPNTEQYWKMWWQQFIKWCTFPIIFGLMLYIGVFAVNNLSIETTEGEVGMMAFIIQIMLFSIFLVGGLIISIQAGGEVSKLTLKQGNKIGAALGAGVAKTTTRGIEGSKAYRAAGQKLTQIPLLNKFGYNMLDKSDSARTIGDIKKREKEIEENRSKDEIVKTANGMTPNRMNKKSYTDYMAARNVAQKKGWLKNDDKAVDAIRKDIRNNNLDLDVRAIRNAFPQYFRIGANGKLEEIDTEANDYHDQIVNNLKKMNPTDLPKNTDKIIDAIQKSAGGDVDKFFEKLMQLKTNQLRAFLDNVDEEEYNQGTLFGGTSTAPKPWSGSDGVVIKSLRNRENKALNNHLQAEKDHRRGSLEEKAALNEWIEAQKALDELQNKLDTSTLLRDTLETKTI